MKRLHIYFYAIAVLVSALIHLFLLNAAVQFTIKLGIFTNPTAEKMFKIRTVERPERKPWQRPELRTQDLVSLVRPDEGATHSKADIEDRRKMLAQRGLLSTDASEAEINKAFKKLFESETLDPDPGVEPELTAEALIAQKIIAIDESIGGEQINVPTRTISNNPDRGWATSDVYVLDETTSPGEALKAIVAGTPAGGTPREGPGGEGFGPREDTMLEGGAIIPTMIKPPKTVTPLDIEGAQLEDMVAEAPSHLRKYPPLDDLLAVRMLTYHAPGEADGYFMVVVEPRRDREQFKVIAKDIVFVVDSSSSVQPPKLERYVKGLQRCVKALNPYDRFDIVEFKTRTNRMNDHLMPVTTTRLRKARYFLDELKSGGNTDVYSAIQCRVGVRPEPNRPYIIFLVTDGKANRGLMQDRGIINKIAAINKNQAAIYSFAGGSKFNEYLLDLLSYRNKGESRFEHSKRDVADSMYAFYEEVRDPILLDLRYQIGTIKAPEVYPKVLPDCFLKSRITICGRYSDEKEFSMQILGQVNGVTKEFIFKQSFDGPDNGTATVARQWAFHKIYQLIGQMVERGEDKATITRIRTLGARYRIQTPYYK